MRKPNKEYIFIQFKTPVKKQESLPKILTKLSNKKATADILAKKTKKFFGFGVPIIRTKDLLKSTTKNFPMLIQLW